MGFLTRILKRRRLRADWAVQTLTDPDRFFYVREWACAIRSTGEQVARRLNLGDGRVMSWTDGMRTVERGSAYAFVVPFETAVFVFARDIGFSDLHNRLSAEGGSAYLVSLDEKRCNILCQRAEDGRTVRQVQQCDGISEEGKPLPGEPALQTDQGGEFRSVDALGLAAAWGPDPRSLVRAQPQGSRYEWSR